MFSYPAEQFVLLLTLAKLQGSALGDARSACLALLSGLQCFLPQARSRCGCLIST